MLKYHLLNMWHKSQLLTYQRISSQSNHKPQHFAVSIHGLREWKRSLVSFAHMWTKYHVCMQEISWSIGTLPWKHPDKMTPFLVDLRGVIWINGKHSCVLVSPHQHVCTCEFWGLPSCQLWGNMACYTDGQFFLMICFCLWLGTLICHVPNDREADISAHILLSQMWRIGKYVSKKEGIAWQGSIEVQCWCCIVAKPNTFAPSYL